MYCEYMDDNRLDFFRRLERWSFIRRGAWDYALLPLGNGTYIVLGDPSLDQVRGSLDHPTGRYT